MREHVKSRRAYLVAVGTAGLTSLAGCASGDSGDGDTSDNDTSGDDSGGGDTHNDSDSPMFQYNAANTGHASSETGPTDPVTEQWRFRTEGDVVSSPAVVDSTVYVASADELYALNARDGAAQWRFPLERNFGVSSPAVVDNTVFATAGRDVVAVNASDGSEQ
mgnify:CR=1 FL=1